jgi:3-(3-hydroxy-phenyl)propionate hydroxylase
VFRLELPHGPDDRHAPFVNIQQFHTERFLLETLARRAATSVGATGSRARSRTRTASP